jgi:hypothetical protein
MSRFYIHRGLPCHEYQSEILCLLQVYIHKRTGVKCNQASTREIFPRIRLDFNKISWFENLEIAVALLTSPLVVLPTQNSCVASCAWCNCIQSWSTWGTSSAPYCIGAFSHLCAIHVTCRIIYLVFYHWQNSLAMSKWHVPPEFELEPSTPCATHAMSEPASGTPMSVMLDSVPKRGGPKREQEHKKTVSLEPRWCLRLGSARAVKSQ